MAAAISSVQESLTSGHSNLITGRIAVLRIRIDVACYRPSSVVYRSVTVVSPAKTAEPIEMPFGLRTRVGPRNHVLGGGAPWRNLANTIEPSMCGGDAACYQITMTTC